MPVAFADLPQHEQDILLEARRGNINAFTNYFMRLPKSGTRWMPDDALGHYRDVFQYELLYDFWKKAGGPQEFSARADDFSYPLEALWEENETYPTFLFHHGYLMLDWSMPIVDRKINLSLAITGTGTSKTSAVAVAALTYCALYPGYRFLNGAPTSNQAEMMIGELEKWITDTPFARFVEPTARGELYVKKPHPKAVINSPFGPKHDSWFVCQTTGQDASAMLGGSWDWTNLDEVQLMSNILGMLPKFSTRSRAQRADGVARDSKLSMLTNPGPNPELEIIWRRLERIQEENNKYVKVYLVRGVDSSVNPYTSRRQMAFQEATMDADQKARWHSGLESGETKGSLVPEELVKECISKEMDDKIASGEIQSESIDELGVVRFTLPRQKDHVYIVTGDPGTKNPVNLAVNNVPVVTAWDFTNFPQEPARLAHFAMMYGNNRYGPWLDEFRNTMLKFKAKGYYDATSMQSSFEDAGAFESMGIFRAGTEEYDLPLGFEACMITFQGNNKKWARGVFVMMMQEKAVQWPTLLSLIYQAGVYRETGEGCKDIADDVLASCFVMTLAMRIDGGLWEGFQERYQWNGGDPDLLNQLGAASAIPGRFIRPSWRGSRSVRR